MLLGCIGDDFTGSSDLANTLAKQGMSTVLYSGVPSQSNGVNSEHNAAVIALKSRSNPVAEAVAQSLDALEWLREQGCKQFFFKYCSTFDSTDKGNIGPVAEAIADALGAQSIIFCPAFPGTGRSVYQGYLFVNDVLLNESGMQNHPITPMRDANLRRVLQAQSNSQVGHVGYEHVGQGASAISTALQEQNALGNRFIVVDAVNDADLMQIGAAAAELPLITGGSGVALGLPANFIRSGLMQADPSRWAGVAGKVAVLSGSCSIATREQIKLHAESQPVYKLDTEAVINQSLSIDAVTEWVLAQSGVPLVYSSADPEEVAAVQSQYSQEKSAQAIESFFASLAVALVRAGVSRLITAGGETSGAVVEGLDITSLAIGPEISPGVPALKANPSLVLALKSGNFGSRDFFVKAAQILESGVN